MQPNTRTVTYPVWQLSPAQREQLTLDLYQVHQLIFAGVSLETFRNYVVNSPAWRTWLFVQHNAENAIVGYWGLHAFLRPIRGREGIIFRMEAGTLAQYRGKDIAILYAIRRMIQVGLRYPTRPSYFFASMVHPTSYAVAAKYCKGLWPRREADLPDDVQQLLGELADDFGLRPVENAHPLVRWVNWITLDDAPLGPAQHERDNADADFYRVLNPTFKSGHGLLTVVPTTLHNLIIIFSRFAKIRGGRALKRQFSARRNKLSSSVAHPLPVAPGEPTEISA